MSGTEQLQHKEIPVRSRLEKYPDYTAEIEALEAGGITVGLLQRIINKHRYNSNYNKSLIDRYEALADGVPIFAREPRFGEDDDVINHKLNNDFFSEIVDFKVGYFAGNPIGYSYADTEESLEDTGDTGDSKKEQEAARDAASKVITDFVTRSNMFDVDMECTKYAAICGYAGRLFYIDKDGNERVMVVPPNECIILSETRDITHPTYGVRYYETKDISDNRIIKAEFYDSNFIYYFQGGSESNLALVKQEPNLFDGCPLQGIPNNLELKGDAEKVLTLIDAYDRALSDSNNESEAFAHAYMILENIHLDAKEAKEVQKAGAIEIMTGPNGGKVYFLTKDINDAFIEHHLDRLEENIYHYSKTPNLRDEAFGTASGVSLKFKLTGLETKCGMFEAKMISAGLYMFTLLAKAWAKKTIKIDPLQVVMDFRRNFPLDLKGEAQAVTSLKAAGLPDEVAFAQLS
nr:phage portal protein [Clostridia bacterium]